MDPPAYPALYDVASDTEFPLRSARTFLVGRNETADLSVDDPTCSRTHFRLVLLQGRYHVEPISTSNPTFLNGKAVRGRLALSHKDLIRGGNSRFIFLTQAPFEDAPREICDSAAVEDSPTILGRPGEIPLADTSMVLTPVAVLGRILIGRDDERVHLSLPHPQVSRLHAQLIRENDQITITDLHSANGTFVNGRRVEQATALGAGDQIDIGPFALVFDGKTLKARPRSDNIELVARGVGKAVHNRQTGQPLPLLEGIELVIRPHEFVCLLGPSGSGKTTLLSILSGRAAPDCGAVLVNERDLHEDFDALKQDIAVVPQKEALHDSLTVYEALWYTARLRLPPDLGKEEVDACIRETLQTVGLADRADMRMRQLSGGQLKRASLANEILCRPSLLFLDEVTSGLDEQTDRGMMELFRSVAEGGKTVVCVTHSTANIERTCHLLVILTAGGRVAFVGKPSEALEYFGVARLGDVYERLAEHTPERWQADFRQSSCFRRYVASRMPRSAQGQPPSGHSRLAPVTDRAREFVRQTSLLTRRYFAIWRSDYLALLAMLGQAVLIAALLVVLFGDLGQLAVSVRAARSINLLFLLGLVSFWFGCNNAAKEIVKERVIHTRERDFNVRLLSYYCSKLALLTLFSGAQVFGLAALTWLGCGTPGDYLGQGVVLLALAVAGVTLGLALSSLAPTEELAITLTPMAVIPQVILAGVVAPVEGASEALARGLVTMYWGNRALDALLPEELSWAVVPPLKDGSATRALLMIAAHTGVYVLVALGALYAQGQHSGLVARLRRACGRKSRV